MCTAGSYPVPSILKQPFPDLAPQLAIGKLISNFILAGTLCRYCLRHGAHEKVRCVGSVLKLNVGL